ncbi:nitroreductase family protein [Microbacterium sp. p3-SID338]|uniref:nitroreductase family protein n=1 Tax=unclassified Microbacterium TaxID=2609290 RepID=UPI0011AFBF99|nr:MULTISPECIES: nitroreductase family protein [unclassified Microbacterium]MCT1395249.1 nitroreductase family protein [Microbacterium sp. p3-SID338]
METTTHDLPDVRRLVSAMPGRRAHRFFGSADIHETWVQDARRLFFDVDAALYPHEAGAHPLSLLVFARRVHGIEPAVYETTGGSLARRALMDSVSLRDVVLQPEFAESAAILVAMGSFATEHSNAHAHRRLLSRAGSGLEAVWLSAVAAGLSGSIFAGFLPSALAQLGIANGYDRLQLLALAVGSPLSTDRQ